MSQTRDLFPSVIEVGATDTYLRNDGDDLVFRDAKTSAEVSLTALRTKSIILQNNSITVGKPVILNFSGFQITVTPPGNHLATIHAPVFSGDIASTTLGYLTNSSSGQAVLLRDSDGITIADNSNSVSVNLVCQSPGVLTVNGTVAANEVDTPLLKVDTIKPLSGSNITASTNTFSLANEGNTVGLAARTLHTLTFDENPVALSIDQNGTLFPALAIDTTHLYCAYVVARGISGSNFRKSAAWKATILMANNNGSTSIINWIKEIIGTEVPNWDIDVQADDVNDLIKINVTGDHDSTVVWGGWLADSPAFVIP